MICNNCKSKFDTEHSFCPSCGQDLRTKYSEEIQKNNNSQSDFYSKKEFFIKINNIEKGPYIENDIENLEISNNTLIRFKGSEEWLYAKDIIEFKTILELSPPPYESNLSRSSEKPNVTSENRRKQPMFSKIFSFDGRIRRLEYGITTLIFVFFNPIIQSLIARGQNWALFLYIFFFYLWIAQGAKRCHDINNSGWYQLIPFYTFWLIFTPGDKGNNYYGPNPKV